MPISPLSAAQAQSWMDAHLMERGEDHVRRLASFWNDAQDGHRLILTAWQGDKLCGHVTLLWQSAYPGFLKHNIPEIVDLYVMDVYRKQKIGRALLHAAITAAKARDRTAIGLGVGVTRRFGAAHHLYITQGFVPDGTGIWIKGRNIVQDEDVRLDDNAMLMLVKVL